MGDTARYGRIEPQPAERTPEEQAEIERLEARQGKLAELDDDQWTQETLTEAESIETHLDEIEGGIEARTTRRREDFGMAGCIVTIAHDGSLQVIQGLVKPEDMPKQTEPADAGPEAGNGHDGDAATHGVRVTGDPVSAPMALPKDREAEARKEAGVGIGLADDLRSIRAAVIKAYLAGDFEATIASARAFLYAASVMLLVRRLARAACLSKPTLNVDRLQWVTMPICFER